MFSKNKKDNKKEKKKVDRTKEEARENYLQDETLQTILAVVFFVLGIFLILSAGPINKAGAAGIEIYNIFHYLFGIGYYLLPLVFFILCISFFKTLHKKIAKTQSIGGLLFFVSSLALINITLTDQGGVVGGFISKPLINTFDTYVSVLILLALIIISLLTIFDTPLRFDFIKSLF